MTFGDCFFPLGFAGVCFWLKFKCCWEVQCNLPKAEMINGPLVTSLIRWFWNYFSRLKWGEEAKKTHTFSWGNDRRKSPTEKIMMHGVSKGEKANTFGSPVSQMYQFITIYLSIYIVLLQSCCAMNLSLPLIQCQHTMCWSAGVGGLLHREKGHI